MRLTYACIFMLSSLVFVSSCVARLKSGVRFCIVFVTGS
ncbi:hypothetical protein PHMEG_00020848 [Phytophthora megakarya]|uniref:RxLR effector protein n=1 Tax=Phytophthora megakarya TaxID=4795 RepID=A0A225VN50_9STRA|nr:hypothetical protein PHMEG_00020848 [Phytophthora megakarya]